MSKAKQKLKVLHLIEGLGSGGAERLLYTNLKHFNAELLENEVITVFSGEDHWKKPIEDLGVPVTSLACSSPRDIPKGVSRLKKRLKASPPDLIHTHLWTANIIGRTAGKLAGIPVISSVHSPDYEPEAFADGSNVSRLKKKVIKDLDKWTAFWGCEGMIAVSQHTRQSTANRIGFPLEKTDVLYNPIDITALTVDNPLTKNDFLQKIGLPGDAQILLNVARVSPQKGLLYAIQAMPEIKAKFPKAYLLSVGAANDLPWIEKLNDEIARLRMEKSVCFLGSKRNVAEFLQNCDVFVFPSLHEGLGIALVEAMAMGCACVASNTGPISEFITHGENGMLTEPKNPVQLANIICDLLENKEKRQILGENAQQSALRQFQPAPAAERLTEIYFSILEHKA